MQLILDTEAVTDIQDKMSSLEEISQKYPNENIETLKTVISNGNKDKVKCQKDILKNLEDNINGINKVGDSEKQCVSLPIEEDKLETKDNLHNNGKDESYQQINGISDEVEQNSSFQTGQNEVPDLQEEVENTNDKTDTTIISDASEIEENPVKDISTSMTEKIEDKVTSEIPMDVEDGTEDSKEVTSNENVADIQSEIAILPIIDNAINTKDNVNEKISLNTKKEIDVTEAFSNESENVNDNIMICDNGIESNNQDILEIQASTDNITSSTNENILLEDTSMEEKAEMEETGKESDKINPSENVESNTIEEHVQEKNTNKQKEFKINDDALKNVDKEEILDSEILTDTALKSGTSTDIIDSEKTPLNDKEDILDVDDIKEMEITDAKPNNREEGALKPQINIELETKSYSKLSNTLDILSDDEDDSPPVASKETEQTQKSAESKQCINIEDDDDIMLIDEETSKDGTKESDSVKTDTVPEHKDEHKNDDAAIDLENRRENVGSINPVEKDTTELNKDIVTPDKETLSTKEESKVEEIKEETHVKSIVEKPLLPENFLKTYKKNVSDMTRDDLEEFCILKIVESIVDRSNLSDIKTKLKDMAQNIEEYKKKAMMLTKQNRDLQVVLKSVQEEQKKYADKPSEITPLKITRSVGIQVLMKDKPVIKKKLPNTPTPPSNVPNRNNRPPIQTPKTQKTTASNQPIPVPRLVLANNSLPKTPAPVAPSPQMNAQAKTPSPVPNGVRNSPPIQKVAEKRTINRVQSVTVDLTDDEPPAKIAPRSSPAPPIRLVPPQNLLAPRQTFNQPVNSPRKVYIPISGPQGQNIRPGQAIMLKTLPASGPGPRPRAAAPSMARMPHNTVRMQSRVQSRHPAPLPDVVKQYQPPNWKAVPPAPDLKLSKVENGIVISWKIEGYQEDSYEEIASYQLYAYQETSSPPNTALWKKIGDVKALPLPMACTLTHVMAGFKYYFAVRAVDIRTRVGPFSLPGSILLLNKL